MTKRRLCFREEVLDAYLFDSFELENCLVTGPTSHARGVYLRSVYLPGKLTEGSADARAANPFALPRLHPGIGQCATTQHAGELLVALRIAAERCELPAAPGNPTRADLVIE